MQQLRQDAKLFIVRWRSGKHERPAFHSVERGKSGAFGVILMNNETNDALGVEEVQETSALAAGIFSPSDLALLRTSSDAPNELEGATNLLYSLAISDPVYGVKGDPQFGRFSFSDFGKSVLQVAAMFRVSRAALDFLELDFQATAREDAKFYHSYVVTLNKAQGKTPQEQIADLYWQVAESLSAAGLTFEALVEYHAQGDGEVKA